LQDYTFNIVGNGVAIFEGRQEVWFFMRQAKLMGK